MTDTKRLEGRVALITGASHGIGCAIAKRFAAEGAHVIALGRNVGALEELSDEVTAAGGTITLLPIDLTMFDKVDAIGPSIYERFGKLDIVVGNAALLGEIAPVGHIDAQVFTNTYATNVTANFHLIRTLSPWMHQSDTPRAVFVTSSVARKPRAFWGPYQAAKAGMEALVIGWADENENMKLRANIFDPGGTRTGMRAEAMPGEDPMTLPTPEEVAAELVKLVSPSETRTGQLVTYRELAGSKG